MGGAFAPGNLISLLHEAQETLWLDGEHLLADAVREARLRLEHPEQWTDFPFLVNNEIDDRDRR